MEPGAALGAGAEGLGVTRPEGPRRARRWPPALVLGLIAALGLAIAAGLLIGNSLRSSSPATGLVSTPHRSGLDGQATWAAGARPAPPITA